MRETRRKGYGSESAPLSTKGLEGGGLKEDGLLGSLLTDIAQGDLELDARFSRRRCVHIVRLHSYRKLLFGRRGNLV